MQKTYIIGAGSGRCGTKSLATLLNMQDECSVSHEGIFYSYYMHPELKMNIVKSKLKDYKQRIAGDVASWHIFILPYLLEKIPNSKAIVLKRDKKETIRSIASRKTTVFKYQSRYTDWDAIFPKYHTDKLKSIEIFYDHCYKIAYETQKSYPYRVAIIDMHELNIIDSVKNLLNWVGISSLKTELVHLNKSK